MIVTDRHDKEGVREGVWFDATTNKGTRFSVVHLGALMQTAPGYENLKNAGIFMGWEAIPLKADGELDTNYMYRGTTLEELTAKLEQL